MTCKRDAFWAWWADTTNTGEPGWEDCLPLRPEPRLQQAYFGRKPADVRSRPGQDALSEELAGEDRELEAVFAAGGCGTHDVDGREP